MKTRFIELFKDAIERDEDILLSDSFRDYTEWDSLAYLSVIAMIDEEFDVVIEGNDFKQLVTIADIINEIEKRSA